MEGCLKDFEWRFICQMIVKIFGGTDYEECFRIFARSIGKLVGYDLVLCCQVRESSAEVMLDHYLELRKDRPNELAKKNIWFDKMLEAEPFWPVLYAKGYTSVTLQSDYFPLEVWKNHRYYKEIWEPAGYCYSANISLYHDGQLFMYVSLVRREALGNFTARDIMCLENLKSALEMRFYQLLFAPPVPGKEASDPSVRFDLTHRESEIIRLICTNQTTAEICDSLHITPSTLNKHISNIYRKTNTDNRMQLYALFSGTGNAHS